jgi:glutamate---cysteine ligase / carboxylate-amine ligase
VLPETQGAGGAPGSLPSWARWTGDPSRLYTLGVEDEVMLLDPSDWSLAQAGDEVLAGLSPHLAASVRAETHAGVVELVSGVHADVGGAMSEVRALRAGLKGELQELGLAVAAAGTHPAADWEQTAVSEAPRYRLVRETMRALVRREPTMALHVHVGVPDAQDAVKLLNALRSILPVLLALSANSPFSQGRDCGFAAVRRVLFQAFPRTGTPRWFASYADYVDAVDGLVAPAAVPDPSFLWWDVRLQPRLGTVEVRVMDAQSAASDISPLVALIQSFARLTLEGDYSPAPMAPEVVDENGFLAARDGMEARLIEPAVQQLVPVRQLLDTLLRECRPHSAALGCARELEEVQRLSACNGAQYQRASISADAGLPGLVARLAERFSPYVPGAAGRRASVALS